MEAHVVECEAERDEACICKAGAGLAVLGDVQRQYEELMQLIDRRGGSDKLQKQVDLLRSWVADLVGQNALLVRAVEDLEAEATAKLMTERRRHLEMLCELRAETAALRRRLERKDSDIRGLVEVLRRLREFDYCTLNGIHFYEITESDIFGSFAQCGDWEPVKDYNGMLREEQRKHEERLQQTEANIKSLRMVNVALSEDLQAMRRMCAALEEQCRAASTRAQFKDDIIREMRRQLKQAKAKLKEVGEKSSLRKDLSGEHDEPRVRAYESVTVSCVRTQPRRSRASTAAIQTPPRTRSEDRRSMFASQESLEQD